MRKVRRRPTYALFGLIYVVAALLGLAYVTLHDFPANDTSTWNLHRPGDDITTQGEP